MKKEFEILSMKCHESKDVVAFVVPHSVANELRESQADVSEHKVKIVPPKRTNSINAYMWALCRELGVKMRMSDIEVYRWAIKNAGVHQEWHIDANKVDDFCQLWESQGTGWFCSIDSYVCNGKKTIFAYKGSSVYDSHEMNVLVDWVVDEAKFHNIKTLDEQELDRLIREWS